MLAIIGAGMYIYPINQEKPTITGRDDSMTTVNDRSSTSVQDQWKLEDLFANEQEWEQEYEIVQNKIKEINSCHGTLSDPLKVKSCFELEDDISIHTERLYVYANMRHHEDTTVSKYQALSDKATKLSVDVGQALSFITPEILSLPDETLKQFIDHPELKPYRRTLQEILRQKPHILSKAEEALLAQAGNMAQAPGTIFGMINNADMQFPKIENEKGELVELTHGNYIQFLESRDQEVRKRAFEAMYSTYKKQKNTIAATLSANLNKNIFYSKVRKFPSALEMSLFSDNISTEVYDNLISTIHEHLPLLHRYIALRKKMLNLDDMHMYDLFTPLVE